MALGYEGYVTLKVDVTEDAALGTGGVTPRVRQRLESNAGYGGAIKTPVDEMGIGAPHNYDWTVYDGSMDMDVHEAFLTNQLKAWLFDRQAAAQAYFQTRPDNVQQFNNCYWNSISLSAAEGGALTGSVSFVAIERDSYTRGGDYIGNKTGDHTLCASGTIQWPEPLSADANEIPIPYWNTFVEIESAQYDFTTWSLDFSQEVVKFFACEGNSAVQEPKFIAVGPMTATFTGDYMFIEAATFNSPDTLSTLYVNMADEQIKLEDLELTSDADALQDQGAIVPVSVEYAAYTLAA